MKARKLVVISMIAVGGVLGSWFPMPVASAATETISGVTFKDTDRDGVFDANEASFGGHLLYLFDQATGSYVASATSAADGTYSFGSRPAGSYRIAYESSAWRSIRDEWVPTTTGSLYPSVIVSTSGGVSVPFGWRPIVRSTSPITTFVGPSGVRIESFNDVVSASQLHEHLAAGELVGAEAAYITVQFDNGTISATTCAIGSTNGVYDTYQATSVVTYASWLDGRDQTLFHEYGHAWSRYFAHMVQQDATFAGYLDARGLTGDPRVNSSYGWDTGEMIADDYRQLFGTATAKTAQHMNTAIPAANDVPGLRTYLAETFRAAPPTGDPAPAPAPAPTPEPLSVSDLSMNPNPVDRSGSASYVISRGADVSVTIRNARGGVVRTFVTRWVDEGVAATDWDRKDNRGRRVKAGSYAVAVTATTGTETAGATYPFSVI